MQCIGQVASSETQEINSDKIEKRCAKQRRVREIWRRNPVGKITAVKDAWVTLCKGHCVLFVIT